MNHLAPAPAGRRGPFPAPHRAFPRAFVAAGAALLALAVGLLPVLGPVPVPAAAGTPRAVAPSAVVPSTARDLTTPTPAADAPLLLRALSPAVPRAGDDLTVTVAVTNTTGELLKGAEVELWVNWKLLYSRSSLESWATGQGAPTSNAQERTVVDPIEPGETREVTITVPIDSLALTGAPRGPRQMALTLRDGSTALATVRTFLVWDPSESPEADDDPVRLSLLAPVTGPAVDPADTQDAQGLAGTTAPGGPLARTLAAVSAAEQATGMRGSLALAVDPALVARAVAADDTQTAAWGTAMAELGDRTDVSPLPPYDPDLGALAHAGLGPGALKAATTAPLADGWTVPSSWHSPLAWPADGDDPDLATLGAASVAGLPTVVVPSGLAPRRGTATGIAQVTTANGPVTALVADQPVTTALTAGTDLAGGSLALSRPEMVQRLLAETAVVYDQASGAEPHLLATFPRGWSPDVEALDAALSALTASGWVRVAPLTDLAAVPAPDVDRQPLRDSAPQDGELDADSVRRLEEARAGVRVLASVAQDPAAVLAEVAPGLAAPASVAWRADPEGRAAAVAAAVEAAHQLRGGLTVSVNTEVTLISAAGSLPITVRNDLPADATVTVALRPDDPRLVVDERPTVTVGAGSEMRVPVPVRALASGDVDVEVQLLTADGAPAAVPVSMQLRVRAGWETVGTAVVAGLVALLFVAGIYRTVRRGRSARRTTEDALVDPVIPADAGRQ